MTDSIDSSAFVRAAFSGELSASEIERVVEKWWATDTWFQRVGTVSIPTPGRELSYGPSSDVKVRNVFGVDGAPGCVYIETPALGPWSGALDDLPVPMHRHDTAHLMLVAAGTASFLCVRDGEVVVRELTAGDLVVAPAGVDHTFRDDGAFDVISLHAHYRSPADPLFAEQVEING